MVVCACWISRVTLKQDASYCCVIGGKARDAQKVACCLRALVSISRREHFLHLMRYFPPLFPLSFCLSLSICVSLAHKHTPTSQYFGSTPRATTRALFRRGWVALGTVVMGPLLIGGYLVLLARGTRRSCVGGKRSR